MEVDSHSPTAFLETLLTRTPASLHPHIEQLITYSERKLYHQLTNQLHAFLKLPESAPFQIELWNGFVERIVKRLDQLRATEVAVSVAQQYEDGNEALAFLKSIQASVDKPESQEAYLLATTEAAHFSLLLGDLGTVQSSLSRCSKVLDSMDNVPSIVHASFYRVYGDFYKSKAEYKGYYKNSLLFLACIDIENDLSKEERVSRAHDLGIAALLGSTIYNFGELLMHPILKSLLGTEYEWLHSMLYAFNEGSLGKFESLVPYLEREPILASSLDFLRPKICLMSLIALIFSLPSAQRSAIPFETIARSTQLPSNEVEYLLMKALSLTLVKGSIDQIAQTVNVSWVQPRVLGLEEIDGLRVRLDEWSKKVAGIGERSLGKAGELLVQ